MPPGPEGPWDVDLGTSHALGALNSFHTNVWMSGHAMHNVFVLTLVSVLCESDAAEPLTDEPHVQYKTKSCY